jgi:hypothetical protein
MRHDSANGSSDDTEELLARILAYTTVSTCIVLVALVIMKLCDSSPDDGNFNVNNATENGGAGWAMEQDAHVGDNEETENQIQALQQKTEEVFSIMASAVDKIGSRDEKLQEMICRAESLQDTCQLFKAVPRKAVIEEERSRGTPRLKRLKRIAIGALVCCVLAIPLTVILVAGPTMAIMNSFSSSQYTSGP